MKIKIPNRRKHPVLFQYQNQCFPQPAYLEFDPAATGKLALSADYSGEIGNAVPVDVWNGKIIRFKIPPYTTRAALKRLETDPELWRRLTAIREGFDIFWNGNNYVGGHKDPELAWMTAHYIEETLNKEMGEW